jgi:hypothetical protein
MIRFDFIHCESAALYGERKRRGLGGQELLDFVFDLIALGLGALRKRSN